MKHAIPNDDQTAWLRENGVNPDGVLVVHEGDNYLLMHNYKTGDEIVIRRNPIKKGVSS